MLERDFLMAGFSGVAFSSAEKQKEKYRRGNINFFFVIIFT